MRALLLFLVVAIGGCRHRPAAVTVRPQASREELERSRERERRRVVAETKRLYDAGVDAYAKGGLGEAKRLFNEVLALDPDHVPAQRALRRLAQRERQER